jgi:hypothetical protein
MTPLRFLSGIALALVAAAAGAQSVAEQPQKPRVHALVAAVGSKFNVIYEEQSVGSHLSPYRRSTMDVPNGELNKIVLKGLDAAIAKSDPSSERIFLALTPPAARSGVPTPNGEALVRWIRRELEQLPRERWDSVLVAIPAYRSQSRERLPSRIEGLGIFAQPLCQSDPDSCDKGWTPPVGVESTTPEGEKIQSNYFVAPYSFIEVWILDPRTLNVLDRGVSMEHQKLYDPKSGSLNMFTNVGSEVLADRFVGLIQSSVAAAVAETEKRGTVQVKERGAVKEPPRQ